MKRSREWNNNEATNKIIELHEIQIFDTSYQYSIVSREVSNTDYYSGYTISSRRVSIWFNILIYFRRIWNSIRIDWMEVQYSVESNPNIDLLPNPMEYVEAYDEILKQLAWSQHNLITVLYYIWIIINIKSVSQLHFYLNTI